MPHISEASVADSPGSAADFDFHPDRRRLATGMVTGGLSMSTAAPGRAASRGTTGAGVRSPARRRSTDLLTRRVPGDSVAHAR